METILNQVLKAQSEEQLGAARYERTGERVAYRNGSRDRLMTTRIGTITLHIPRRRGGSFSTDLYERYQRSEQALLLSMIEMVIKVVSTRKVSAVTEELCGSSMSESTISRLCGSLDQAVEAFKNHPLLSFRPFVQCDSIDLKVREDGKVRSKGLHIVVGINQDGIREVLGFSLSDKESEISWEAFFCSPKERGLKNVDLLTSDAHVVLTKAIPECSSGCSWRRCQTHFSRNVLDSTPSKHKTEIHLRLQQMYQADDIESTRRIKDEMMECYAKGAQKALDILEKGFDEVLTVLTLPRVYRKRLRATNGIERLNEEIRRRDRVIRIYPSEESALRLIGALLQEQSEVWGAGKRYFNLDEYHEYRKVIPIKQDEEPVRIAA